MGTGSMNQILVTGAQGYVGRHIVAELARAQVPVVGVGRSPVIDTFTHRIDPACSGGASRAPLPEHLGAILKTARYRYIQADLCNAGATRAVLAATQPAVVVHLAAALRDESWSDLVSANVTATSTLIEAIGEMPTKPAVIYGSSGSVYGAQRSLPFAEDALPCPVGLYSASKHMGEIAAQALGARHGVRVVAARIFNLVGPGLQDRHLAGRLAHEIAAIELGRREPRIVTGPLTSTRDLIDVRVAARMLVALARRDDWPAIVNIGSGEETPIARLAQDLVDQARCKIDLEQRGDAVVSAGADRQVADTATAERLGLRPELRLGQSLSDMLAYARGIVARTSSHEPSLAISN